MRLLCRDHVVLLGRHATRFRDQYRLTEVGQRAVFSGTRALSALGAYRAFLDLNSTLLMRFSGDLIYGRVIRALVLCTAFANGDLRDEGVENGGHDGRVTIITGRNGLLGVTINASDDLGLLKDSVLTVQYLRRVLSAIDRVRVVISRLTNVTNARPTVGGYNVNDLLVVMVSNASDFSFGRGLVVVASFRLGAERGQAR